MAAASFSIREYAASMRTAAGAEGRRPFGIEDLPPMEAPRFRWWADELGSAVHVAAAAAAAASPSPSPSPSPRRSMGKTRPPKKRSISDLFAAAPPSAVVPAGSSGGSEHPEVDDDEALCAIVMRAKEEKRRKRILQEQATAAAAAAAEGSGGRREPEGNFASRKEALDKPNLPDELDTQASKEPEGVELLGKEKEKISDVKRRKQGKINNMQKKADSVNCIESKKANKVGKSRDLEKMLPLHSILKKYTKHTSVKMVKEKHGSSKGTEVIELRCKSVKRVKFSEANDVLGSNMQSCKLPKQQSFHKLLSDAMASSSSSSSSSSSRSMSGEADKCITAESSSSHRPEEALTQSKEANQNTEHEDSPKLPLIDLNEALPESTDVDYTYDSNSEVPNVGHRHEETLDSGVQVLDGRENQRDLSSDSYGLRCLPPATDLERIRNSRSALLHGEAAEVSDIDIVHPRLSLRELAENHRALPDRTVQDPFQQYQNQFSANLNHGGSQLSNGVNISSWQSRECNLSRSKTLHFHSGLNARHDCQPSTRQTVRLMGKDVSVSTSRGECSAEMAEKLTGTPSFSDHLLTNVVLPQQGQSFLSLQAQSFPNVSASPTSTSHVLAYSASSSQAHLGYRTPHDLSHTFPAANAFSADRSPYEHRFVEFSSLQPNQHLQLGCPPLHNHGNATFHPNVSPRRNYFDPFARTEPPTAPFLLASREHGTSSSVAHGNLPQPYGMQPALSSVRPHNSASVMFSHPGRTVQEASDIRRDATLPSRNLDNRLGRAVSDNVRRDAALPSRNSDSRMARAVPDNVRRDAALPYRNSDSRTGRAVPDNSRASSSGQYVQRRSGPVKLTPGAKHLLVPSDTAGDDNSLPVYSCVSFGSRRGSASASQNKGA